MKIYLSLIFILTFIFTVFGQTPTSTPQDDQPIKVNTLLVNMPVVAGDRDGRNISGLTKDNFTILQDGEKQPIEFFADSEASMNVAILVDTSPSSKTYIKDIKKALPAFIQILRSEDKAMIATFDYATRFLTFFTSDHEKLLKSVSLINTVGEQSLVNGRFPKGSRMQDAMYQLIVQNFASLKGRKAIVVLTDGTVSGEISNQNLLSLLSESDVTVYPIIFKDKRNILKNLPQTIIWENGEVIPPEEFRRRFYETAAAQKEYMKSLTDLSGGRLYESDSLNFKETFENIADELKKQYLIGFYPQTNDEKEHEIKVEVNPKNVVIRIKRKISIKPSNN